MRDVKSQRMALENICTPAWSTAFHSCSTGPSLFHSKFGRTAEALCCL